MLQKSNIKKQLSRNFNWRGIGRAKTGLRLGAAKGPQVP
jgi:hypothetical protein